MILSIIHLSDLHIKESRDILFNKMEKIKSAIVSRLVQSDIIVILITGDIACYGAQSEYSLAYNFFDEILKSIKMNTGCDDVHFVSVPGNHDCDFSDSTDKEIRDIIVGKLKSEEEISPILIQNLTKSQSNYFDFLNCLNDKIEGNSICGTYVIEKNGYKIAFNLINSSWMSTIHEKPGSLILPLDNLLSYEASDANVTISAWHHPTRWFQCENDKKFRSIIEPQSNFVFIGHEHVSEHVLQIKRVSSNKVFFAGAMQEHGSDECSFNVVNIYLDTKQYDTYEFIWNSKDRIFDPVEEIGLLFDDSPDFKKLHFSFSEKFNDDLNDFGISILHHNKDDINLDDLYIAPDLEILTFESTKDSVIKSAVVIDSILEKKATVIFGEDTSGKSSLAKILVKKSFSDGKLPILIDGASISSHKIDSLIKLFKERYAYQYTESKVEQCIQVLPEDKVIIIDNFNKVHLNHENRKKLIELLFLPSICGKLILLVNGSYSEQAFLSIEDKDIYSRFELFQIKEFGHRLRYDLIRKWHSLGQEGSIDDQTFAKTCETTEGLLNTVIGKRYIPTYPSYLLLILQQGSQSKINENASTYGHLYEFLISGSLLKSGFSQKELEKVYTYLSAIAFYMYVSSHKGLGYSELLSQTEAYNDEYDMTLNVDSMLNKIIDAKIFKTYGDEYCFKYAYFYYFFVAKYLSANFEKEHIKKEALRLLDKLHLDDYSNILIFLCHFNKSEYLFSAISHKADSVFLEIDAYDFDCHTQFINDIQQEIEYRMIPKDAPSSDVYDNKTKSLVKRDAVEDAQKDDALSSNGVTDEDSEDPLMRKIILTSTAFRTINVIGHIIKNYAGSINKHTKALFIEKCHSLGMRTLRVNIEMLQECIDPLIEMAKDICLDKKINLSDTEIRRQTKELIFNFAWFFSYSHLRIIAQAIASDDLIKTYERLERERSKSSLTLAILNANMNQLGKLDSTKLLEIAEKYEKSNNFCFQIVRRMLYDYLYFNKCDLRLRQQLCDKLGFDTSSVGIRYLSSPENKISV